MAVRTLIYLWISALLWCLMFPGTVTAQQRTPIQFLSVAPDANTRLADQKLLEYLRGQGDELAGAAVNDLELQLHADRVVGTALKLEGHILVDPFRARSVLRSSRSSVSAL